MDGDLLMTTQGPASLEEETDNEELLAPRGDRESPVLSAEFEQLAILRDAVGATQDQMYLALVVAFIEAREEAIRRRFGHLKTALHVAHRCNQQEALTTLLGSGDVAFLFQLLWQVSRRFDQKYIAVKALTPVVPTGSHGVRELTGYGSLVVARAFDALRGTRFMDFGRLDDRTRVARQMGLLAPIDERHKSVAAEYHHRSHRVLKRFIEGLIAAARSEGLPDLVRRLLSVYGITGDTRAWKKVITNTFMIPTERDYDGARAGAWILLADSLAEDAAFEWSRDALKKTEDLFDELARARTLKSIFGNRAKVREIFAREVADDSDELWRLRHVLVADRCLRSMEALEQASSAPGRIGPRSPHSPFAEGVRYVLVADPSPEIRKFLWDGK